MALGALPWEKVITHEITAEKSPAFFDAINAAPAQARCIVLTGAGERAFGDLRLRQDLDPCVDGWVHAANDLEAGIQSNLSSGAVGVKPLTRVRTKLPASVADPVTINRP